MSNETVAVFEDFTEYRAVRNNRTNANVNNMTIDSFGISKEYALKDYNITSEDLDAAIEDVKLSLLDDPLLTELENTTQVIHELIDMEMNEADSVSIIEYWLLGMENNTIDYFTETECSGFEDCVLYAFSVLYGLYTDTSFVDSELNRNLTSSIENKFLTLLLNTTTPVISVYKQAINIIDDLSVLNSSHMFCAVAPNITNTMNNVTVLVASDVKLACETIGEPIPQLKWYQNDMLLEGESKSILQLINIAKFNQGMYKCIAENVVTQISSAEAFVKVRECTPGTFYELNSCRECEKGEFQEHWNKRICTRCPLGYSTINRKSTKLTDCIDINECIEDISGCEQICKNTNGSFICDCYDKFDLESDGKSCTGATVSLLIKLVSGTASGLLIVIVIVLVIKMLKERKMKKIEKRSSAVNGGNCEPIIHTVHGSTSTAAVDNPTYITKG